MIKDIARKWCETGNIDVNDAVEILTEYCYKFGNRIIPPELMQLFLGPMSQNIQWDELIKRLSIDQDYQIVEVYSAPDIAGRRHLVMRKFYEE